MKTTVRRSRSDPKVGETLPVTLRDVTREGHEERGYFRSLLSPRRVGTTIGPGWGSPVLLRVLDLDVSSFNSQR